MCVALNNLERLIIAVGVLLWSGGNKVTRRRLHPYEEEKFEECEKHFEPSLDLKSEVQLLVCKSNLI
jgi:hypothetical protein